LQGHVGDWARQASVPEAGPSGSYKRQLQVHVAPLFGETGNSEFSLLLPRAVAKFVRGRAPSVSASHCSLYPLPCPKETVVSPSPGTKGPTAYFPSIERTYGKPVAH
jgi:hypothetical protein